MSENQEIQFTSVTEFVNYIEASEDVTLDKAYVVETLKEILSRPSRAGQRRGALAGLTLEEMTDEQLKREIINAKSVLYKAQQRGASAETIEANQARVDAAIAERDSRKAAAQPESTDNETVDEDIAAEL